MIIVDNYCVGVWDDLTIISLIHQWSNVQNAI